jgi:predicted component of type VI protein secretion system
MKHGKLTVTVVDHEQHRQTDHEFTRGPVRVGRDPENELHLAYRFVSSWHAVIKFDARTARVEDLGTVNGLSVDGQRVEPGKSVEVRGRLVVAVGPLELIVEHTPGEQRRPAAREIQPTPADALHKRDRLEAHGAINTDDEPPILSTGHTMAMNLSKVHGSALKLRPLYDKLSAAHAAWTHAYAEATRELKAANDETGLTLLRREFPAIGNDGGGGGPVIVDDADAEFYRQAELGAVAQAAEELVHGLRGPADLEETRRFLARVVDVLRTFAVSTVEQLAAMDRQDHELGVRIDRDQNPVLTVDNSDELLRLLLDWRGGRADRTHQLVEALASALAHPAALLRGALDAGRRVSEQLAPREIERNVTIGWPTRSGALWRRFEERYEALFGDNEDGWARALRGQVARAVHDALTRAGVPMLQLEIEEEEEDA